MHALAQPLQPQPIAARFVAALQADDFGAVAALAADDRPLARRWTSLTELIDRYDCISIRSYDAQAAGNTVIVDFVGTAVTAGKPRQPVDLPSSWYIETVAAPDGVRVKDIASSERRAARAIVAGTMSIDDALADRRNEPRTLLREIVDEASDVRTPSARDAALAAVALARAWHDRRIEALGLRRLSIIQIATGRPDLGAASAQQSLAAAEASGDADLIAGAHFSLGTIQRLAGDFPAARVEFQAAAANVEEQNDPRQAMRGLYMVGFVDSELGHLRDALAAQQQLAQLAEEYGSSEGRLNAADSLGSIYGLMGDYEKARAFYEEAQERARKAGDMTLVTVATVNLADMDVALGRESAVTNLRQTAELSEKYARPLLATAWMNLGNYLVQLHRYDEAEDALCRAFASAGPRQEIAMAPVDDWTKFDLLTSLAELRHAQGRDREALPLATEARMALLRTEDKPRAFDFSQPGRLNLVTGRILRALGRRGEAIEELANGVGAIENQRAQLPGGPLASIRFLRDKIASYRELVDALQEDGRVEEALAAGEQMKARALRDILERGEPNIEASMSAEFRKTEETLNARIVSLNTELRAAGSDADRAALRQQLDRARVDLDDFLLSMRVLAVDVSSAQSVDPKTIVARLRSGLPEDVVVLEYVVLDRRTIVFAITRSGRQTQVTSHVIPISQAQLTAKVEQLENATSSQDLEWPAAARSLYDALIAPVASSLQGRSLLCVVPDGVLWKVPFSVLGRRPDATILDRLAVAYAPSLATLRAGHHAQASAELLAMANPVDRTARPEPPASLRSVSLGRLPEAEDEVHAIARLYPRSRVYVGREAAERVVKEHGGEYRIIHLATHGLMDGVSPLYSAVVLAASDHEDGLLEAREIVDMHLNADLVVLSACETARGNVGPGEGLIGMSWALMIAGCPTSIVSQWKVASRSTADLMIELHRNLVHGLRPAEALRLAQLRLRRDARYEHPFYWAPFVVMGRAW